MASQSIVHIATLTVEIEPSSAKPRSVSDAVKGAGCAAIGA